MAVAMTRRSLTESDMAGLLSIIRTFIEDRGYPPSVSELVGLTGMSRSGVHNRLQLLAKAGRIVKVPGQPRAMRIVE